MTRESQKPGAHPISFLGVENQVSILIQMFSASGTIPSISSEVEQLSHPKFLIVGLTCPERSAVDTLGTPTELTGEKLSLPNQTCKV